MGRGIPGVGDKWSGIKIYYIRKFQRIKIVFKKNPENVEMNSMNFKGRVAFSNAVQKASDER